MKTIVRIVLSSVLTIVLLLPVAAMSMQTGGASAKTAGKGKNAQATTAPSAQEIATAKSQGLVWVNLGTRVYHKDGGFYGKTKRGKFMSEEEAKKEGFHEAKESPAKKSSTKKQADQSGIDATVDTHSSTPPKP